MFVMCYHMIEKCKNIFSDVKKLLQDFEELLSAYAKIDRHRYNYDGREIIAIGVCFEPCARKCIIKKSVIYLG